MGIVNKKKKPTVEKPRTGRGQVEAGLLVVADNVDTALGRP